MKMIDWLTGISQLRAFFHFPNSSFPLDGSLDGHTSVF